MQKANQLTMLHMMTIPKLLVELKELNNTKYDLFNSRWEYLKAKGGYEKAINDLYGDMWSELPKKVKKKYL